MQVCTDILTSIFFSPRGAAPATTTKLTETWQSPKSQKFSTNNDDYSFLLLTCNEKIREQYLTLIDELATLQPTHFSPKVWRGQILSLILKGKIIQVTCFHNQTKSRVQKLLQEFYGCHVLPLQNDKTHLTDFIITDISTLQQNKVQNLISLCRSAATLIIRCDTIVDSIGFKLEDFFDLCRCFASCTLVRPTVTPVHDPTVFWLLTGFHGTGMGGPLNQEFVQFVYDSHNKLMHKHNARTRREIRQQRGFSSFVSSSLKILPKIDLIYSWKKPPQKPVQKQIVTDCAVTQQLEQLESQVKKLLPMPVVFMLPETNIHSNAQIVTEVNNNYDPFSPPHDDDYRPYSPVSEKYDYQPFSPVDPEAAFSPITEEDHHKETVKVKSPFSEDPIAWPEEEENNHQKSEETPLMDVIWSPPHN